MAALCNRGALYFCPVISFYLLSSFFPRLISAAAGWMSTILCNMVWPYCKFIMQVWNVLHAARCKCRTQKSRQNRDLGTIPQLCRAISSQLRHVSTIGKKLVKQQYLLYMSATIWWTSALATESVSWVWGTPGNFASWQRYCTAL